jgi:hypothetical protein
MDASFDQFAGGGWGEQTGGQDFANITSSHHKSFATDKIPIPATVEDLLTMSNDEEKFVIGGYSFNTVKLMGRIVSVHTDTNQCTTYELCDGMATDPRVAKRFTVIRYGGAELQPNIEQVFSEGHTVQAVGKLRLFNNRLSLVSFHIRDVSLEQIEIFKMECRLAKHYYSTNIPEKSPQELANTLFKAATTRSRGVVQQATTPGRSNVSAKGITPNRSNQPKLQQYNNNSPQLNLTPQQLKILDYIRRFGDANKDGTGVHVESIRMSVNPDKRSVRYANIE